MISDAKKEQARALIRAGELTTGLIARQVGVSPQTVQRLRVAVTGNSQTCAKSPRLEIGLKAAGFEILAFVSDHSHARQRRYRVRFSCCGDERDMTEKALMWRMSLDAQWCNRCARRVCNAPRSVARRQPPVVHSAARDIAMSGAWR